jgi:hypothetical protein
MLPVFDGPPAVWLSTEDGWQFHRIYPGLIPNSSIEFTQGLFQTVPSNLPRAYSKQFHRIYPALIPNSSIEFTQRLFQIVPSNLPRAYSKQFQPVYPALIPNSSIEFTQGLFRTARHQTCTTWMQNAEWSTSQRIIMAVKWIESALDMVQTGGRLLTNRITPVLRHSVGVFYSTNKIRSIQSLLQRDRCHSHTAYVKHLASMPAGLCICQKKF